MSAQPLETRMAHVEGAFLQVDRRLESLERTMTARFADVTSHMESRFNQVDSRFSLVDQRFNWLTGIVIASWLSTIVTVLFHH
ncbi:MAG: hypothetical protein JO190_02310 [Candidatus Eremiobacteraeota bacterium]|nr:hypothetical protein [Candidatus Eremiobacteraeota bacterium]MBV8498687.1 hypothetical protein [Candidatus Eremiobacteraeota bacterium]